MTIDTTKDKEKALWLNRRALSYEKDFAKVLKQFQLAKPKAEVLKKALEGLKAAIDGDIKALAKFEKEAEKKAPAKKAAAKKAPKKPAKK